MDERTRRWLDCEQTVNERLGSEPGVRRLDLRSHTVAARYHPERRGVWPQEVVWLPRDAVRMYGAVDAGLHAAFGRPAPRGRAPLLLHPQAPAAHRRLREVHGHAVLEGVSATPTASFRTVVAWCDDRDPVLLKLSLGASIGTMRRSLTEYYLVTGILVSHLLDTIPHARRRTLGLDWFPEPAGAVEASSGTGWILRHFPAMMREPGAGDLVPVFSLVAALRDKEPMLVGLIRESGLRPEHFVVDRLLRPYVTVLAHLLLEEGLQLQGHGQNVLVEVDRQRGLTGRIVLRDLVDSSVNVALRLARQKPLPRLGPGLMPRSTPFPLVRSAIDYRGSAGRRWPVAAADTVERWGLRAFVWSVNASLSRYFPGYRRDRVEREYLELWRDEVIRHLAVDPVIREEPQGLPTDEALTWYLSHADWTKAGGTNGARLPRSAEALPHEGRLRRKVGPVYQRVESAWGDLYVDRGSPAFFRPAF